MFYREQRASNEEGAEYKQCSVSGVVVKKLTKCLVLAAALLVGALHLPLLHLKHKKFIAPITPERTATHMIAFYNGNSTAGYCTGTAVGPHALLTASHCTDEGYTTISLDLSVKKYHIIGKVEDGSDHTIVHLDGPAFTDIVTIKERQARIGEVVTSYGDGGRDFPQHTYFGHVIKQGNGGDTSELDARDGMATFDIPVIPGDSGSAVYGTDGDIVALVTYSDTDEEENIHQAVGFALSFTPEQLRIISGDDSASNAQLNLKEPRTVTLDDLIKELQQ